MTRWSACLYGDDQAAQGRFKGDTTAAVLYSSHSALITLKTTMGKEKTIDLTAKTGKTGPGPAPR